MGKSVKGTQTEKNLLTSFAGELMGNKETAASHIWGKGF